MELWISFCIGKKQTETSQLYILSRELNFWEQNSGLPGNKRSMESAPCDFSCLFDCAFFFEVATQIGLKYELDI